MHRRYGDLWQRRVISGRIVEGVSGRRAVWIVLLAFHVMAACDGSAVPGSDGGPNEGGGSGDGQAVEGPVVDSPVDAGAAADTAGDPMCKGTHPIVDAGARTCVAGDCYCSSNDACYPAGIAVGCCSVAPTCTGADGGSG